MYKILIADDEDIIRRGLAGMVGQYAGLEVAALAEDGEAALEKAKQVEPDLMLVDINMPFMNGFEFIREAKKLLPDIEIVIVTGYDDFAFVKQALQLGVADYLLKPIMEEPLFKVLDEAVARLDKKAKSRKYMKWLTDQMEQNRPAMLNDFFRSWLRDDMDQLEITDRMQYLNIRIPIPYSVTILHLRSDPRQIDRFADQDTDLLLYGCENIAKEVLSPYGQTLVFRTEWNALVIISEVFPQQQWEELARELTAPIEEYLRIKADLVRYRGDNILEFPDVFEQAMQEYRARQRYSDVVANTISMIEKEYGNSGFSLQTVAGLLYVTPQYLSRIFHRETGGTFGAYLTGKRIKEAMRLLQNPDLKMYEISEKTGYNSQYYFSNSFKRALGISPAEYRKAVLEQGGIR